ncbi:MAG: outer membrane lipoprotein carrier protein LolA [Treponema sp.]|nr:outer membrane lipoprotein carrier protein LolA [Treponema sp.]
MTRRMNIIITITLLGMACVYGQNVTLQTVTASLAKRQVTTGDFTQIKKIRNRTLTSTGTFIFSREGIIWDTQKPFPSTIVIGTTAIVQIMPDGKRTVIEAAGNQMFTGMSSALTGVFAGDISQIEDNFSVAFNVQGTEWEARLTPRDSSMEAVMQSVTVHGTMNSGDAVLTTIVVEEPAGSTITYILSNQKYPGALTDEQRAAFVAQ